MSEVLTNSTTISRSRRDGGKKASRVPLGESREAKFTRLALQRMPKAKAAIRLIGNLATYPHTDAQRVRMLTELRQALADVEAAFAPRGRRSDQFAF